MKRLIPFLASLYPRSWRERYGAEFAALLEEVNPDWRALLDILKTALEMQMMTWNFGKILLAAGVAGALVAAGISFAVPKQYASQTVLSVTGSGVDAADAVFTQAQQTESRGSLMSIIKSEALYPTEQAKMPIEDVVEKVKRNIGISPISGGSAFAIEFTYEDPHKAQQVAQDLAASFIRENVRILDAASLPQSPVSPNRWMITAVGLAVGLVLGAIIALLRISKTARILAVTGPAGALLAFAISFAIPNHYVSTAVLKIDPGNQAASNRLSVLARDVLSRDSLVELTNDLGLYQHEKAPVEALQKNIEITPIRDLAGRMAAFAIRFEYGDPHKAQRVAQSLANRFIDGSASAGNPLQVLDAASFPQRPSFPNRPSISLTGIVAGLCMGGILALTRRASRRTA
jgi:capsular polysaccharide biosynthesis protein